MSQIRNGDNFRTVSADVQADVLGQFYAMEEMHPRGRRRLQTHADQHDMRRRVEGRSVQVQMWTPERRDSQRERLLAYHAHRLGIDVSEMSAYRLLRKAHGLTEAEAVSAVLSSRKTGR